jgi:NAD(P)-dependent dehydrogenase (short-subunit alcohol dehydrogenase family)
MAKREHDLANLRRIVDDCLWGRTSVIRHAAPRMAQGSITFTSGNLSSRPRPGSAMLTAMLSAVEALAPVLALELAPVRVNAVTPGLIDTRLLHTASHRLRHSAGHDCPEPGRCVAGETGGHGGGGRTGDFHADH